MWALLIIAIDIWSLHMTGVGVPVAQNLPPDTPTSITLTWIASGDDGWKGVATFYDLRYSTDIITSETFLSATRVDSMIVPKPAGQREIFVVKNLQPNTIYYFAIRVGDEVPNWSPITISKPKKNTI